jgi:hypothetical protein
MELNELEELRNFNELDLLYKIIEISENCKKRTEQIIKGNKTAGVEIRHSMQDVRLLAELIRESVQIRNGAKNPDVGNYKGELVQLSKLEKAIIDKKESISKEEKNIEKRIKNLKKTARAK